MTSQNRHKPILSVFIELVFAGSDVTRFLRAASNRLLRNQL